MHFSLRSKSSFAPGGVGFISYLVGVLIAIPYAYPADPIYVTPFIGLILLVVIGKTRARSAWKFKILCGLIVLTYGSILNLFIANSVDSAISHIGFSAILTLSFVYFLSSRPRDILLGFSFAMLGLSVYMIYLILSLGFLPDYLSLRIFASSQRRFLADYIMGWPNVFATMQIMAAFFFRECKFKYFSLFIAMSSLLTTSRSSILGIILFFLPEFDSGRRFLSARSVISLSILAMATFALLHYFPDDFIADRLAKVDDRSTIYSFLFEKFAANPFGFGSVDIESLGANFSYVSYHNSFLKISIRYGVFGLVFFVLLLLPVKFRRLLSRRYIPAFYLLVVSFFQDFILQANLFMIYFVLLAYIDDEDQSGFVRG